MKKIKILSLFALLAAAFTACDTPNIGGDEAQSYGDGETIIAQFTKDEETGYFLQDNGDTYTFNAAVDFVGANDMPLSSDMVVTYEVDASSTAVAGTDYDFVDPSGQVTIPAGSTYANIPISVYSGNLDSANPTELVLNITVASASGHNVLSSGNHGTTTITLQATCTSNLAGIYSLRMIASNGWDVTFPNEEIIETGAGAYKTTTTYRWPNGQYSSDQSFNFQEVCGRIEVPSQGLFQDMYMGNEVTGTSEGLVDSATGDLTIYYSVSFSSGIVTCTGQYTKL